VGAFVGFHFLRESANAAGCVQQQPNQNICAPSISTGVRAITETANWYSARVGVAAEWNVTRRFKLSGSAAWVPYTKLDATDEHWLRNDLPFATPETGHGSGAQFEAIASYAVSDSFNVGIGGRYWNMNARGDADFALAGGTTQPIHVKYERYGVFLQGAYTFGVPGKLNKTPWVPGCC
jgi:hypothetical protein